MFMKVQPKIQFLEEVELILYNIDDNAKRRLLSVARRSLCGIKVKSYGNDFLPRDYEVLDRIGMRNCKIKERLVALVSSNDQIGNGEGFVSACFHGFVLL